ncbi:MAG TPA: hypothetical protein PLE12_01265 [Propionicimonas sp.]|nr:hypothetical protein [Propionicimonas sp.]
MPTNEIRYLLRSPLPVTLRGGHLLQLGREPGRGLLITAPPDAPRDGGGAVAGTGVRGAAVVLAALERPRNLTDLERLAPGVPTSWLIGLLHRLRVAGLVLALDGQPVAPRVAVIGSGALAATIAGLLAASPGGLDVLRLAADEPPAPGPPLAPLRPESVPLVHWGRCDPDWPALNVVATGTDEPDRALTDALLRSDRDHLVVRLEPGRGVVGPFVRPGVTACVRCLDLTRSRQDAGWPRLLAQLCLTRHDPPPVLLAWTAATACAQVLAALESAVPDAQGRTVELAAPEHAIAARAWTPHPDCGCIGEWTRSVGDLAAAG